MSKIDYQALREAAEKATWGDWDSYKPHRGARGYEVRLSSQAIAQHVLKNNAEFIAAFNPKIALALLDERERNQQYIKRRDQENEEIALTVGKLRVELEAAEKRIAELEARAFNPAILDVIAERQRQQSVEGWMPEHDDEHCNGELAMAAVCYINETGTVNRNGGKPWGWPWDASWWKPTNPRRDLVKAGALILAEIERIDRQEAAQ
ncbi:ead/Ea22-like family protein [Escherichia coli]